MKKKDLKKVIFLGLSSGLILSAQAELKGESDNNSSSGSITKEMLASSCGSARSSCGNSRSCGGGGGGKGSCGAMRSCGGNRSCGGGGSQSCGGLMRKCGSSCGGLMRKCGSSCGGLTAQTDDKATPSSTVTLPGKNDDGKKGNEYKDDQGNMGYHLMTEQELLMELDDKGRALYNKLDKKGKELARYVASQRCNGTNMCAGLNACQTEKNKCAGQGACKGQGKCAFADKNQAVKVVYDKMSKKRSDASP